MEIGVACGMCCGVLVRRILERRRAAKAKLAVRVRARGAAQRARAHLDDQVRGPPKVRLAVPLGPLCPHGRQRGEQGREGRARPTGAYKWVFRPKVPVVPGGTHPSIKETGGMLFGEFRIMGIVFRARFSTQT